METPSQDIAALIMAGIEMSAQARGLTKAGKYATDISVTLINGRTVQVHDSKPYGAFVGLLVPREGDGKFEMLFVRPEDVRQLHIPSQYENIELPDEPLGFRGSKR